MYKIGIELLSSASRINWCYVQLPAISGSRDIVGQILSSLVVRALAAEHPRSNRGAHTLSEIVRFDWYYFQLSALGIGGDIVSVRFANKCF